MSNFQRVDRERSHYSEQQVKEILAHAMDLPGHDGEAFSRPQMVQLAGELGISEAQLSAAEEAWLVEQGNETLNRERRLFITERRREMRNGIVGYAVMAGVSYLASISGIAILSVASAILMVPMFVIAIILFFGTWEALFETEGEDFDKAFIKWLERREEQYARLPRGRLLAHLPNRRAGEPIRDQ